MGKCEKFFNTAGPVNFEEHYKIEPLDRWNLGEILSLINQKKYFLLHAPRQTGKTSTLLALQEYLNKSGDFTTIYINVECAQVARHNVENGIKAILSELGDETEMTTEDINIADELLEIFSKRGGENSLKAGLSHISKKMEKPVILLIDEIDSLIGDTLISVLRQLRSGYKDRSKSFPQSVILCGLVDIKDYKIHRSDNEIISGGSCFNIKAESLLLKNFTKENIKEFYLQHTSETGQIFEEEVFDLAWKFTGGQPWLVNALAYEVTFNMKNNRDRSIVITIEMFHRAKENLILSRATHLDQLADKLKEERVRRVIEPIIKGENPEIDNSEITYCVDLGLIKKTSEGYIISNKIYSEVIPRELTDSLQNRFLVRYKIPEWVKDDESINIEKLMNMFVQFWRENSDVWKDSLSGYVEAAPHLIFQGFLQRVANGHGEIDREYALGNGRVDLFLKWKGPKQEQRIIFELKIRDGKQSLEAIKKKALLQTAEYADKCNPESSNILIFDRRENIDWKDKVFEDEREQNGYKIKIWGM